MSRRPPDFQALFAATPGPCMALDCDLTIVTVNDAFLAATGARRSQIEGRLLVDVFPDNPDGPDVLGIQNALASFDRVLQLKRPDVMAMQRHDLQAPARAGEGRNHNPFQERYWLATNSPVFDGAGEVGWILLSAVDVTESHRLRRRAGVDAPSPPGRRRIMDQLRELNPILRDLDDRLFDLLEEHLKPVSLKAGQLLIEAYEPVERVYFLLEGLASTSRQLEDGATTGVAAEGAVGMVGLSALLGLDPPSTETRVQIAASALKMDADVLRGLMADNPALRPALSREAVPVFLALTTITAACNARHSLHQRLARWLLAAHDWVDSLDLQVRQESIAMMLGVRRTGISEALARMIGAGLLETGRNRIRITDLTGLEAQSCGCYRDMQQEFDRIGVTTDPGHGTRSIRIRALFAQYADLAGRGDVPGPCIDRAA